MTQPSQPSYRLEPLARVLPSDKQSAPWLAQPEWFCQAAAYRQLMASKEQYYWLWIEQADQSRLGFALVTDHQHQNWQSLSCVYTPEYQSFCDKPHNPQHWQLLIDGLDSCSPDWQQLHIWPVREEAKIILSRHQAIHSYPYSINWQASADHLAVYWQQRPSALRNTIARKQKKLQKDGAVIEIHRQLTPALIAAYWQVYDNSWKDPELDQSFINWLLEHSQQSGALRLGIVKLQDKPIACQLWLVYRQSAYIVKLAQDEKFDHYSPGSVLMSALLADVYQQDAVQHIDFLTGNDRYKAMWMDHYEVLYGIEIFNKNKMFARLRYQMQSIKNMVKKISKRLLRSADVNHS